MILITSNLILIWINKEQRQQIETILEPLAMPLPSTFKESFLWWLFSDNPGLCGVDAMEARSCRTSQQDALKWYTIISSFNPFLLVLLPVSKGKRNRNERAANY